MIAITYSPSAIVSAEFLNPEMARAQRDILATAPPEAETIVVTSAYRHGDPGRHGDGYALDWDAVWDSSVRLEAGEDAVILQAWAARAQALMGAHYDCFAHGPGWHGHCEFDPKSTHKPVSAGFYARIQQSKMGVIT